MASTEQILQAAAELGRLVASHPATAKFEQTVKTLEGDQAAQRTLNDYNRQLALISDKESQGTPIEVDDKRKLASLQDAVAANPTLREFQMAQMDYLDLMRKVDDAIADHSFTGRG